MKKCPQCGHEVFPDHLGWHDCEHCGWKEGPQPYNFPEENKT